MFSMTGVENLKFVDGHTLDISALVGESKDGDPNSCVGAATLNTAIQRAGGDNKAKFTIALLHSVVATNLENLKLLAYLKQTDANGVERDIGLASWNGRMVLVDDSMPVETVAESAEGAGDGYDKYTTYVFGDGAVDYEDIGAKIPYEMSRDASTNGGQDTLHSRQRKAFAPYGISYTRKSQASPSPTDEELANGANWTLVHNSDAKKPEYIDHKAIPIARIISRG